MTVSRPHRRLFAWLAIVAMLWASLAPGVAQALASGAGWVQVCTAQGMKWIQADGAGDMSESDPLPTSLQLLEHCPYCALHSPDALGMPTAALTVPPSLGASDLVPAAFLSAPHRLHAWVQAQPRAPPLSH